MLAYYTHFCSPRLSESITSEQPAFSNFTIVNVAPGTVFVDFGFLEPGALSALPQGVSRWPGFDAAVGLCHNNFASPGSASASGRTSTP